MASSVTEEELHIFIRAKTDEIREHVDSVIIFCTLESDEGDCATIDIACSGGNTMANYGHVKQWIKRTDERQNIRLRRQMEEEDDDDFGADTPH